MFIIAWIIVYVLQLNSVIIPAWLAIPITVLAVIEGSLYLIMLVILALMGKSVISAFRDWRR